MIGTATFPQHIAQALRNAVRPRVFHGAATSLLGGFGLEDVDRMLTIEGLRPPFIALVNASTGLTAWNYTSILNTSSGCGNPASILSEVIREGTTIILQHLHRRHAAVHVLAAALQCATDPMTVQCNAYFTPAHAQGVKPHADQHHTLLMQMSGAKHWRVWGNVDRDPATPMVDYAPGIAGRLAERTQPELAVSLGPGDCLMIPRGHVHSATTGDHHSLHLTFGFSDPTIASAINQRLQTPETDYHADSTRAASGSSARFPIFVEVI
jgi:hypothetical protein